MENYLIILEYVPILVTSRIYNNSIMYVEPIPHYMYCVRFRNKNWNTSNKIEYILCGGVEMSSNPSEFGNYGDILLIKPKKLLYK